jgi:hypothetical protein
MGIKKPGLTFLFLFPFFLSAQQDTISPDIIKPPVSWSADKKKVLITSGAHAGLWAGSFITLNKAWYKDYPRSSFHLFNDNNEWNQVDKAGHLWTAYHFSRLSTELWRWSGLPNGKSILLGSLSGIAYQSIIEIHDGYSTEWGFSMGDMTANLAGAATYAFQEIVWKEQRLQIKFSNSPGKYPADLVERRNQLFGDGYMERILKDYNAQTYWLSGNLKSFLPSLNIPPWLNISVGYGAEGMLGGTMNVWIDKNGELHNRPDIARTRRFFLAPDVDLTKIKTKSSLLRSVFFVVNMIKFPAPALELNSKGRFRAHILYF